MKKSTKTFLKTAAITSAVAYGAYKAIGNYLVDNALSKKSMEKMVEKNQKALDLGDDFPGKEEIKNGIKWFENNANDLIHIYSENGDKIYANQALNDTPSDVWVVCCHGYTNNPCEMGLFGAEFVKRGYNVLFPHLRGHGESEHEIVSMGWLDRFDVIAWIYYIIENNPNAKIILHGVSMGGATVMMVTGEGLPENVVCAVEDCGYSSVYDEFKAQISNLYNLPDFPFLNAADSVLKSKEKYSIRDASCAEQVKKSKTPTLFIHGEDDDFVPFSMLNDVYTAASCEKERLVIPNAAHAMSVIVDPQLYWSTFDSFVHKYI